MAEESVLSIVFRDRGSIAGRLRIASAAGPGMSADGEAHLPDYIDPGECENVGAISDESQIDGETPIQLYAGCDPNISPILLLEETDYELLLKSDCDRPFSYLVENSGDIALKELRFRGEGGESIYLLRFSSYVGKGFFDIESDGTRISVPFEVRSKKIGYRREYPRMLADIARFSVSLLMEIRSPLHTEYSMSGTSETAYEDFLVLDHVFSNLDLPGVYRQVRENRHSVLRPVDEIVPSGMAMDVDSSRLPDLLMESNLCPMEGGPIAGRFAPLEVAEGRCYDDYDTPENRMVKDLILTVQRMTHSMLDSGAVKGSGYVEGRLMDMRREIDEIASERWLEDVGGLETVPYSSNVLHGRHGYAELFEIYQILGIGAAFRQTDAEEILKGQNTKLHRVYEYWCYTRLFRCLDGMSTNHPEFPMATSDGRWTMTIRGGKGVDFVIPVDGSAVSVTLYYNREFNRRGRELASYSVRLRPDYTLVIRVVGEKDRIFVLNFDAKYKSKPLREEDPETIEPGSESWEFDIYKMHTYRDALLHSCGSYVLYPGTERSVYRKPWRQGDPEDREAHIIPSVGSIPLVPGADRDSELEGILSEIFGSIVSISEGEVVLDDPRDYMF